MLNPTALQMLKGHEQCRLTAYRDQKGVWTIGWGHTGPDARPGHTITQDRADALLVADLETAERAVRRLCPVDLTGNQYGALVSFAYNAGQGALQNSTLRRRVLAHRMTDVARPLRVPIIVRDHKGRDNYIRFSGELMRWVNTGGMLSRGLLHRRSHEAALWCTPDGEVPVWPPYPDRP